MDCFYCGGKLLDITETQKCCMSCGKMAVYNDYIPQDKKDYAKLREELEDGKGKEECCGCGDCECSKGSS